MGVSQPPTLPPPEACAAVLADQVSTGHVQQCLRHPGEVLRSEHERPTEVPRASVWASPEEWERIALHLLRLGILEEIAFEEIAQCNGRPILNGMFGVAKSGTSVMVDGAEVCAHYY